MSEEQLGIKEIDESRQGEVLELGVKSNSSKKAYIESYGCAMNFSDSEIVASILSDSGYTTTTQLEEADLILVNTCSIREKAESTVRQRIKTFRKVKSERPEVTIGVLGCMAERMKAQLLEEEKLVDLVVGPDAYRDLPNLIAEVESGQKAVNVILSKEETYGNIEPVRLGGNGITAFISITRGCDNMCSFCVVPFTRGRERSRDPESIVKEAETLFRQGYKEVTLLGQNVDSYLWAGGGLKKEFDKLSPEEQVKSVNFAQLMEMVARANPRLRIRFSTSHPKDMTDDVLKVMAKYNNICNCIHLPAQSGNNRILEKMNRGYTREWYLDRIASIRKYIPDCAISTDIIAGFCSETEEEHQDTVNLMKEVCYEYAYMYKYSERPSTLAERKYKDDVPEQVKARRLQEIIDVQRKNSFIRNEKMLGKEFEILVEGESKKSKNQLYGRNSQNMVVVFPKEQYKKGDYVRVKVINCTSATLLGTAIE